MQVESLIKKKLMKEPEGQVLEDALCLVFLERQLSGEGMAAARTTCGCARQ